MSQELLYLINGDSFLAGAVAIDKHGPVKTEVHQKIDVSGGMTLREAHLLAINRFRGSEKCASCEDKDDATQRNMYIGRIKNLGNILTIAYLD